MDVGEPFDDVARGRVVADDRFTAHAFTVRAGHVGRIPAQVTQVQHIGAETPVQGDFVGDGVVGFDAADHPQATRLRLVKRRNGDGILVCQAVVGRRVDVRSRTHDRQPGLARDRIRADSGDAVVILDALVLFAAH